MPETDQRRRGRAAGSRSKSGRRPSSRSRSPLALPKSRRGNGRQGPLSSFSVDSSCDATAATNSAIGGGVDLSKRLRDVILKRQQQCNIDIKRTVTGKRSIEVLMQPEKNVRARYVSEGNRAPIRGLADGAQTYPAVQIHGYEGPAVVDVYLANPDGESPHPNILVPSTNTSDSCEEVTLPGAVAAIRVQVDSSKKMRAVFDNLSIRRLRKQEIEKRALQRGGAAVQAQDQRDSADRSKACLKFMARIPTPDGGEEILTALSAPLQCAAPQESSEIHLVSPAQGSVDGGYLITLVGKRFKMGFKVLFFTTDPNEPWEEVTVGNKEYSNQGAAVVTVPKYFNPDIDVPTEVHVQVRTGTENQPLYSEPMTFTYLPRTGLLCDRCSPAVQPAASLPPTPPQSVLPPATPQTGSPEEPSQQPFTPYQTSQPGYLPTPSPSPSPTSVNMTFPGLPEVLPPPAEAGTSEDISQMLAFMEEYVGPEPTTFPSGTSLLHDLFYGLPPSTSVSQGQNDRNPSKAGPFLDQTNICEEEDWRAIESVINRLEMIMPAKLVKPFAYLVVLKDHRDAYLLKLYHSCRRGCLENGMPVQRAVLVMENKLLEILELLPSSPQGSSNSAGTQQAQTAAGPHQGISIQV